MSGYIGNIPVPQATQTRDTFTATAGQTTFATSGYTPSFLDVFLNGVHLVNGTDYTATNGSDVVLTSGAADGDTLEVVAYSTFEVNSQTFTGTTTLTGDLQATTATFSGAVTGTDATLSGGVYLGGTGSANYLDDYETGTYTPTVVSTSTNPTGVSYTFALGSYEKVGDFVSCHIRMQVTSLTDNGGNMAISLPFTVGNPTGSNNEWFIGSIGYASNFASGYTPRAIMANEGAARCEFWRANSTSDQGSVASRIAVSQLTSGFEIYCSIAFRAA